MPYCPKCNAEYQEGYTMCADCKVPLVDSPEEKEEEVLLVPFFQAEDKKIADKLSSYFNYSDLPSDVSHDEESGLYIVSIPPKAEKLAKQLYQAFYFVERENIANGVYRDEAQEDAEKVSEETVGTEETVGKDETEGKDKTEGKAAVRTDDSVTEEDTEGPEVELYEEASEQEEEPSEADDKKLSGKKLSDKELSDKELSEEELPEEEDPDAIRHTHDGSAYVMKEDKYKDLTSTAWIFLLFGAAGILFVILNVFGILTVINGWLPNIIMTALFLFFLYVAVSTRSKAKTIRTEIAAENKLTAEINEWLKEHLTEEFIRSVYNENVSEELNYIKLTDTVKDMLLTEFGPQNTAYLDRLIEDYYNSNIDQSTESEE